MCIILIGADSQFIICDYGSHFLVKELLLDTTCKKLILILDGVVDRGTVHG